MANSKADAPNHNELWTDADKNLLREMFNDNEPLIVMAETLGRSATSACAMLVNLKLLYYWKEDKCFYPHKKAYATYASLRNLDNQLKEKRNGQ